VAGLVALSFLLAPLAARPQAATAPAPATTPALLANERHPLPAVVTGGAPATLEGFAALAAAGYRTYVDLRGAGEVTAGTSEAAAAAGLAYVHLPIAGEGDLDLATARALDRLLDEPTTFPVAIACASGNRSGALLAVEAFWLDGAGADEALALGQRSGLTRLEPSVRTLLGLEPAPQPTPTP
jgi:protein tyrosine phosphatase (PTP) superfamily phosphohydrolase (DUF442 family)